MNANELRQLSEKSVREIKEKTLLSNDELDRLFNDKILPKAIGAAKLGGFSCDVTCELSNLKIWPFEQIKGFLKNKGYVVKTATSAKFANYSPYYTLEWSA